MRYFAIPYVQRSADMAHLNRFTFKTNNDSCAFPTQLFGFGFGSIIGV